MLGTGLIVLCAPGVLRNSPSLLGAAGMLLGCIAGIALGHSAPGQSQAWDLSKSRLSSCL